MCFSPDEEFQQISTNPSQVTETDLVFGKKSIPINDLVQLTQIFVDHEDCLTGFECDCNAT